MKRFAIIGIVVLAMAGCGGDKYNEPYKDAPRGSSNSTKADVGTMPDGFSNYATKCDRPGIRVYVLFHQDAPYGGLAVIADPSCK